MTTRMRRPVLALFAVVAVLAATLGWHAASAAFSGSTSTPTNSFTAASSFATCAQTAKTDGAYGVYPLSDTSGTVATDVSGNNYHGTYKGGFTLGRPGPCTRDSSLAVAVDGSTGWITTNYKVTPAPTVFSIEIWFRTATAGYASGGGIIGFGINNSTSPGGWDRQVYMSNDGTLQFGVSNGTDIYVSSTATFNDGGWHHLVATLGSSGQRMYVDGNLVASGSNNTDDAPSGGYWRFGHVIADGTKAPSSNYFKGTLAHGAMYPSELTLTQVRAHYAARQ